jgi:hypothetical protein
VGFPIRKSPDQSSFAAPRRLSQRITSFIACACQGIHQLPLRHLIIHIANTHPGPKGRMKQAILKRPASRDLSDGAVRQPIMGRGLSVLLRRTDNPSRTWLERSHHGDGNALQCPGHRNPNKSSLYDVMQNRRPARWQVANLAFLSDFGEPIDSTMVEPDGIEPTTSCLQSRRSPS